MNKKFTFRKEERLCSIKIFDRLFKEGKSLFYHPLKVVYLVHELNQENPVQAAFTASKKNFRKASSRNFIKRKLREAYRLNKPMLLFKNSDSSLAIVFMYVSEKFLSYSEIEKAMKIALIRLNQKLFAAKNERESNQSGSTVH